MRTITAIAVSLALLAGPASAMSKRSIAHYAKDFEALSEQTGLLIRGARECGFPTEGRRLERAYIAYLRHEISNRSTTGRLERILRKSPLPQCPRFYEKFRLRSMLRESAAAFEAAVKP